MLIPPVLGFIADYFSLGDLPQAVAKQIKSFREWILGLIEKALDWIIEKGKGLLASMGIGKKEKARGRKVTRAVATNRSAKRLTSKPMASRTGYGWRSSAATQPLWWRAIRNRSWSI